MGQTLDSTMTYHSLQIHKYIFKSLYVINTNMTRKLPQLQIIDQRKLEDGLCTQANQVENAFHLLLL